MTTPPTVITWPVDTAIAGDDTSTPDTALSYGCFGEYTSRNTAGAFSMPEDDTSIAANPDVDTENVIDNYDGVPSDTAISYFIALSDVLTGTLHRSGSGGDYYGNPNCNQKRVGAVGG